MKAKYQEQTKLLLEVLPIVGHYPDLALKGGTALNYFLHDMPRLSVDIDLQYLPLASYSETEDEIGQQLKSIISDIQRLFPVAQCHFDSKHCRILMRNQHVDIKIESNYVIRGYVFEPETLPVSPGVSDHFGLSFEFNCLNRADLYAGKLCAALDRQHPRDLFDIRFLLDQTGVLERDIVLAFVVYLACSKKSIRELLDPRPKQLSEDTYRNKFEGMAASTEIGLAELEELQIDLPALVRSSLTDADKQFLLDFKRGVPDWSLLPIEHVKDLPAVRWKMQNLDNMDRVKRQLAVDRLREILD